MSSAPGLIGELKRRNVFRVGAAYLVVGWLLIEVADTVFPRLGLPDWTVTLVIAMLLLGLPVALFLAWAFELTPEGVKRTEEVSPAESVTPHTGRTIDKLILAGMVVVIAVIAADRFVFKESSPEESAAAADQASRSPAEEAAPAMAPASNGPPPGPVGAAIEVAPPQPAAGIAVLPFVNMSPDPENAYFADGISEELLNILAGVEGLKVASRTSAFSFKGKDTPIPEIARQLGVRHVLEGSVRKQGQRVRITAQLIEAGNDAHLWSQTYERELVDIFRVQEEIARAITAALEDVLGVRRVTVEAPTRDLAAYERFLRGRTLFYQRTALDEAVADLEFAVERDPGFAEAWAFLGAATGVLWGGGYETRLDRAKLLARSEVAGERALELDPDLPLALANQGRSLTDGGTAEGIAAGLALLERAASRVHPDSSPRLWYGLALSELGYVERALPLFESARDQDPLVHINHGYLGYAYAVMGREQEAERAVFRGLELQPLLGNYWVLKLAISAANRGESERAAALLISLAEHGSGHLFAGFWIAQAAALKDPVLRQEMLDSLPQESEVDVHVLVTTSVLFGDADRLFAVVERGTQSAVNVMRLSAWLPGLAWLREDPRFFEFMRARGAVDYWQAHGFPTGCRAVDSDAGRRLDCAERGP
jgi:TolB-like protein